MLEEGREVNDIDCYPLGVTDQTINEEFGDRPTCYECRHLIEICCDFGVCALKLREKFGVEADPEKVIEWSSDHLQDMQEDICGRFEQ